MSEPTSMRRWFRFSLRTLFVMVTVGCACLGWLGVQIKWIRDRHAALRLGTVFVYEPKYKDFSFPPYRTLVSRHASAPLALRLFGEEGRADIGITIPKSDPEYLRLRNLFPEANLETSP